jgi:hypothetical protein
MRSVKDLAVSPVSLYGAEQRISFEKRRDQRRMFVAHVASAQVGSRSLIMLGFLAMMSCFAGLVAFLSYWVSWEMQHKDTRPSFQTKIWTDLMDLIGKRRDSVRNARFGPVH